MINLWPLLLPAAAYSGWWIANRHYRLKEKITDNRLSREYVVGLNHLLNEQPDKAVDIFIKILEIDSETVETHLALGSLFRRRGEVDRAIRIHQNLIARPQLSFSQKKEALIALGQDYMNAGLFDRAERIFLEVTELDGNKDSRSLHGLLAIYQQEKAWDKALLIAKKLSLATNQNMSVQISHYYCELAEQFLNTQLFEKAQQAIKQAIVMDKYCVRASLLQANIHIIHKRYKQAIQVLKKVPQQDSDFLSEVIATLLFCYDEINARDECIEFLNDIVTQYPRASIIFVIGEQLKQTHNKELAFDFVSEKLSAYHSLKGLNRLIHWYVESSQGKLKEKLEMLYHITSKFLDNKPIYRCIHCGFGGKYLHWHCPSCKQWGKMKPVIGLEGD